MTDCNKTLANVETLSETGLSNSMALLVVTAFVPADIGLAGVSALVAAGHGIVNADCGTTSVGATIGTLYSTHRR